MAMRETVQFAAEIKTTGEMPVLGKKRTLNVLGDPPDIRDRMYEPALVGLEPSLENIAPGLVLDQGTEGACTGFGLAAVINLLKFHEGRHDFRASTRMLYEMAKKHDEWPGESYDGSSCRGAIRGWHNMGVCEEKEWPYSHAKADRDLTIERAVAARRNALGAYYRLRPVVADYHAALNETGAVYVSANVHSGWSKPSTRKKDQLSLIKFRSDRTGGHAFAIVGYDAEGFIVQNSWGPKWGSQGFALWTYEDWLENIMDGWVFRLAVPTPQIFGMVPGSTDIAAGVEEAQRSSVKRVEIQGHFVHFDDGRFKERGDYWSTLDDVKLTAERVAGRPNDRYGHLMIYAHGGLNAPDASARRVRALRDGFTRNGIYPYHIMYDTGLVEELKDVIKRALGFAQDRVGGFTDWTDGIIEDVARKPVTPIWEEMKRDAALPFNRNADGAKTIAAFAEALAQSKKQIHLVGHSTGGILLGHLLRALDRLDDRNLVASCTLMAPACTMDFYQEHYAPRLGRGGGNGTVVRLPKLTVYNLNDSLEHDDNVAGAYRKSLLFLVSRALERVSEEPLLGMQRYSASLPAKSGLEFVYSNGRTGVTRSRSHGGFDNDENTMNDILKTILGRSATPKKRFTEEEMRGY